MASISFSEIEGKIIDNAGCFENTPEKRGLSLFSELMN